MVAQGVVDGLQSIQVDHQQAESALAAARPPNLLLQGGVDLGAVEEPGQWISDRQLQDPRLNAPLVRGEHAGEEGEQPDRADVDAEPEQLEPGVRSAAGIDDQHGAVRGGCQDRHQRRHATATRQGCRDGDHVEDEEERRAGVIGEQQQAHGEGETDQRLDRADECAAPRRWQELVDGDHGHHGDRPKPVDRYLVLPERVRYAHSDQDDSDRHPPQDAEYPAAARLALLRVAWVGSAHRLRKLVLGARRALRPRRPGRPGSPSLAHHGDQRHEHQESRHDGGDDQEAETGRHVRGHANPLTRG